MTSQEFIAALDVGTSRVKGAVYRWQRGERAELVASASMNLPPLSLSGLRAEQDTAPISSATLDVVARLKREVKAEQWACLAIATQRGTMLPLGDADTPLMPMISWLDRRAVETEGDRWLWLERHAPKIAGSAKRLASVMGWLVFGLTGECLDTTQTSSPDLIHSRIPTRVVSPGSMMPINGGPLSKSLGLPRGMKLVLAGGDKNCELVGAGCIAPGLGDVSFGTAVSLGTMLAGNVSANGVFLTPSHVPGLTQAEIGLPFGGGVWAWLESSFGKETGNISDRDLADEAPLFIPYLAGSLASAQATGAWWGLTPSVTPRTLAASGLEGILMELRRGLAQMPQTITKITLAGGGARNPVLPAWLADVLGLPVQVATDPEVGLAGAAMTAAVFLGLAATWAEAAAALASRAGTPHTPRPERQALASRRYARWLAALAFPGDKGY